jgi:hypothetical protein
MIAKAKTAEQDALTIEQQAKDISLDLSTAVQPLSK